MRRPLAWFCLAIALTGPFVVQARVAYGLALAVSEIGCNVLESGQEIEDEAYDGHDLVAVVAHSDVELGCHHALPLSLDVLTVAPSPILASLGLPIDRYWRGHRKWPPPIARQRRALLQVFLI